MDYFIFMSDSEKFKNKYRIKSSRLEGWDYSSSGVYFVTICTKNREHHFGEIKDEKMYLSEMGGIISEEWINTKNIRKNVQLDEWVIMPNHIHGIIFITEKDVETHCNASLHCNVSLSGNLKYKNKFGPQLDNLSSIIRGFKGIITKQIHKLGYDYFAWQSRFHDRIIRNEEELNRIREYIISNPKNWEKDENNIIKK